MASRSGTKVLGAFIDAVDWETALNRIHGWSSDRESRYVCICNAHSVVTAGQDKELGKIVEMADMATPDGAPVAWMLNRLGFPGQKRINGPDLMWKYCALAAERGDSIFLYGGRQETLDRLRVRLLKAFPGLKIAGAYSPPFRSLTAEEDAAVVEMINASGAGTVWVSLGCPKQEKWMAAHRGRIHAVMIGVGAAFDYHSGKLNRAPQWMQSAGLEWLHRLISEPARLWKRYLVTNPLFLLGAARQLMVSSPQDRVADTIISAAPGVGAVVSSVSVDLILVRDAREVLLAMRNDSPNHGCWYVPGGKVFKDEAIDDALVRVAEKEFGLGRELADEMVVPHLLGAYDHACEHTSVLTPDTGSCSVVLGHLLEVEPGVPLPREVHQHNKFRWWSIDEAIASPLVHGPAKDYLRQRQQFLWAQPKQFTISPQEVAA